MSGGQAVITLRDGTRITFMTEGADDLDELTRFVDAWQSGRRGGADINARNGKKVSIEYRDVLRVDFPEGGDR